MNLDDITTVYDLARVLPDIDTLQQRCRALATLEAIIGPEWESRYYSYDADWNAGEQMASMRNGSGDEYSIVFSPDGVFIRAFDHESKMSPFANDGDLWDGLLDGLPEAFLPQANEPAFSYEGTLTATCCLWRLTGAATWNTGNPDLHGAQPDGARLLAILCDSTGESYRAFAADYYEVDLDLGAVTHVYAGLPLTDQLVGLLNPDLALADILEEVTAINESCHA